ncbi:UvrD-helicase domain-containing protein [Halomicronema sp. CCY15110]|uniref:UvrD-helicase domain-containing protein n=1 Tax=Halomicronema sp. CCY15110 TaxID=2767773 RepID=UPI00194EAF9E|nr:ATP-dependent helicase [Halomicronema sp. CCY15110]
MITASLTLQDIWQALEPRPFQPNPNQANAILHTDGPLYLTAGPGSGKTRVLLWRTLNLIVFHGIQPEEIFLSTFTEKAARQLREGLQSLLGIVTNQTGQPYDIARMYVGTVHALCQQLMIDRRFSPDMLRPVTPGLMDALDQYFYLSDRRFWEAAIASTELPDNANYAITEFFNGGKWGSSSRHKAVTNCLNLFNRFSEECLDPAEIRDRTDNEILKGIIDLYAYYKDSLGLEGRTPQVDFALLQQQALQTLQQSPDAGRVFKHVIIDEYQDTNSIQEQLFFQLAAGHQNICVVGDDDQALYRFRGATVENFVQFPERVKTTLDCSLTQIPLDINYRSRKHIVDFYTDFMSRCNWSRPDNRGHYRVVDKDIRAHSSDHHPAVVASSPAKPDQVVAEIAELVKRLLDEQKVADPNQIAFLFPSLKSKQVERMRQALEAQGLSVYAPRAGRFLEVEESVAVFGLFLQIFGRPERGEYKGDYAEFQDWLDTCLQDAHQHLTADPNLATYVGDCQDEIETVLSDYQILCRVAEKHGWELDEAYTPSQMEQPLAQAFGLSEKARKSITNVYINRLAKQRHLEGNPFSLKYIINRATSLDWSILDLFYRLCAFQPFKSWFDLAEQGSDEGPICNLGLVTQYLSRFLDHNSPVLTASFLQDSKFINAFFMRFVYSLFRLGESEFENAEDPFPKGRIPFLTIHQSKGLEFPVVILGNPRKDPKVQPIETIVRPLIDREGEPLERMAEFDVMRMFYVALSRAENLLVLAHFSSAGNFVSEPFRTLLDNPDFPRIPHFDTNALPVAAFKEEDIARAYSYTSDYLLYQKCPRQYMLFRKYGFVASRTQTQMFGSVVHQTLEDLHDLLIAKRT